ncbi:hydroxyethylthiazole kinase [Sporanaerobium hydrogeniformans]|uniref:Hydroxyethylthiazole kinase n=1 Tax=Sporanaerobium hydrogeniformans TaxID=3072179 RepID=A0AC61D9C8_9FIRM|nr:hydroxyethylthiazole kinase [Sporanaerobium hydrogeniformans]PHV69182.1 hydroxyethylthiazole kinase [Sporanaerobium hydrogeniformans]
MIHQRFTQEIAIQKRLKEIKDKVNKEKPLVHCLTNTISINDCANAVLALGGKPIMAEHPREVKEVTVTANALALNLGNITDSRMEAMLLSAKVAYEKGIPSIIDLVGVGCSKLRREYAKELIKKAPPSVIKGNMSELKALYELPSHAQGIDVGKEDEVREDNLEENTALLRQLSKATKAVIVATGAIDLIVYEEQVYRIDNGCEMLTKLTGTGCMLNVMIATLISTGKYVEGAVLGTLMMGIAGERSQETKGNGSFRVALLDQLCTLTAEEIIEESKLTIYA